MRTVTFEVDDELAGRIDAFRAIFERNGIAVTRDAETLFLLALSAQQDESPGRQERVTQLGNAILDGIIPFRAYFPVSPNGELTFNLALHVVSHLGSFTKYPWTPTAD